MLTEAQREKARARNRRYAASEKGRATIAAKNKRYKSTAAYKAYQQKWRAENKHKRYAETAAWVSRNKDKKYMINHNYRARKKGAYENGTAKWYVKQSKCAKCASTKTLQVDHIIPLALGGAHIDSNMQTLCRSCNSQKRIQIEV